MDNASDMIFGILNNPDAMKLITDMLGQVGDSSGDEGSYDNEQQAEEGKEQGADERGERGDATLDMGELFNPEMIMKLMGAISGMSEKDDGMKLLLAIKPYLSDKRRDNFDNAVKILKLSKLSGIVKDII